MRKFFAALLLSLCIVPMSALSSSASVRAEKNTYYIDDAEGSALIKNGNKKQARQEAQQAAYRDAIAKAMDMFAGGTDEGVKNRVLAKSQSMVKNFKITSETVEGDTLHIVGSCTVSEKTFDGVLGPEVISMLGNPRVMIIVDKESSSNASLVEDELLRLFEKAGYLIVDRDQAQTLLALDPKKGFSDPDMLDKAAKTIRADIIIEAHATSGAQKASRFGINMYKPSGSVKVKAVLTKTGYQISSSTYSRGTKNWQGSSSAAGIIRSGLQQATEEIIYKIAYKMLSPNSLDGINVNIRLANATFDDIEQFTAYLGETGKVFDRGYSSELTELDFVSGKNARNVASHISKYKLPGNREIKIEGLTAETVNARVVPSGIIIKPSGDVPVTPARYVIINIYLEKLYEEEANRVRAELKNFIGSAGEVEENFRDSKLLINVKFAENAQGAKSVFDLEEFLKNEMKRKGVTLIVDPSNGNSIRGSGDHIIFFGN
ncbi:MAG: hypothetical protein IJS28_04145 [Synergistaceae bacterium]|nr:hypothetical protein [Synergistaceae bacterium]